MRASVLLGAAALGFSVRAALADPASVPAASSSVVLANPPPVTPPPATPSPVTAPTASSPPAAPPSSTCTERLPEGKARPKLVEKIAARGTSGHAQLLTLIIEHGPGETVLPGGFRLDGSVEQNKALEAAQFYLPDPGGDAKPTLERKEAAGRATTTVKLNFVPLPSKPGRNQLVLPALPIAVARASGEVMTLCTSPHEVLVEDPIANAPDPKPKRNPEPRRQLEEWTTAKHVTYAALVALVVGALVAWLLGRWLKRPRPAPPPPPARPAWEVALEALFDLRHSGLLAEQRYAEYYDRVSDTVRRYLGDRYGYDGLESTTREALSALRRVSMPMEVWAFVQEFMQEADLVKFARRSPTEAECSSVLERAQSIVQQTRPVEPTEMPPKLRVDSDAEEPPR